jgi:hypothetical protein
MNVAVMQPYFFPYIGYFQLVTAVDKFVYLDDVNYNKKGWMNRNRLMIGGSVQYFTIPVSGASQNQKINEVKIQVTGPWREKMTRSLAQSYAKAPFVNEALHLLEKVLCIQSEYLSDYAKTSIKVIADYLDIKTTFIDSSQSYGNGSLSGSERILDIAKREEASVYYNLPGGASLYDDKVFNTQKIELRFIRPNLEPYPQNSNAFTPGLSILDVLMFNDRATTKDMLLTSQSQTNIELAT